MNTRETEIGNLDRVAVDETGLMGFDRLSELAPKTLTEKGDADRLALAGRLFSKVGLTETT